MLVEIMDLERVCYHLRWLMRDVPGVKAYVDRMGWSIDDDEKTVDELLEVVEGRKKISQRWV